MSITDELRRYISGPAKSGISHICEKAIINIADRIDAEHQKALDEWKAKDGQTWLRGYAECHAELMEGNEVIAADLEKAGWVELPKDADGEVIHVGDTLVSHYDGRDYVCEVEALIFTDRWDFQLSDEDGDTRDTASLRDFYLNTRHYQAPTVEDVLDEFVERWHDTHHDDIPALLAEYAGKLRLAGDAE